jgi:hypothetical protein
MKKTKQPSKPEETKPQYITKDFYGTVILKDWMTTLTNRSVMRVTGFCTLVQDVEIAGFKTRGTEANWGMRVVGSSQQITILGCQIRAVIAHPSHAERSLESCLLVP